MTADLRTAALSGGVDLTEATAERLMAYQHIVERANATQNLTALRSPDAFLRDGVLDSLFAWRALALGPRPVLDVGSGAGLPALVWAIAGYAPKVLAVEAERRKCAFLEEAAAELGLQAEVAWGRAEDLARGPLRDQAVLVTARAVAAAPVAVEVCGGLVRPGGLLVLLKGTPERSAAEAAAAAPVAARMGFGEVEIRTYDLGQDVRRTLLVYGKRRPTPAGRPTTFARLRREFRGVSEREGAPKGE